MEIQLKRVQMLKPRLQVVAKVFRNGKWRAQATAVQSEVGDVFLVVPATAESIAKTGRGRLDDRNDLYAPPSATAPVTEADKEAAAATTKAPSEEAESETDGKYPSSDAASMSVAEAKQRAGSGVIVLEDVPEPLGRHFAENVKDGVAYVWPQQVKNDPTLAGVADINALPGNIKDGFHCVIANDGKWAALFPNKRLLKEFLT